MADQHLNVNLFRVHDLPVEIFSHIISALRDLDSPGQHRKTYLGWLNVTFVSKSWRAAALSNRTLWTSIPLDVGKIWPDVFLERSHPLPIDIDLGKKSSTYWEDLLLRNFYRIRSLEVDYGDRNERRDPIEALIKQPSKTLEILSLRRYWHKLGPSSLRNMPYHYPRLHTLHLAFGAMNAEEFPWRDIGNAIGLTELAIHLKQHIHDNQCLSDVLHVLKQLRSLATLDLKLLPRYTTDGGMSPQADSGFIPTSTHLSNLEHLTLEASGEMILRILDHISFSTSVETTLVPHSAVEYASLTSILIPWISARSRAAPPRRLAFTLGGYPHRIQISAARSLELERGVYLRMQVDSVMQDAFPEIMHSLEPDAIRIIDIASLNDLSNSDNHLLSYLPSSCPNATCITILPSHHVAHNAGVLAVILRRLLLVPKDSSAYPPFPNLAILDLSSLHKKTLSERCTHREDVKPYRVMPPTLAQSIVDTVRARQDAGGVMPRVYLRGWTEPMSRFEEGVLEVMHDTPGLELLRESEVPIYEIPSEIPGDAVPMSTKK